MSDFTVQIEGPGLTLKREVEEAVVLRVLGVLLGSKAQSMFTQASGLPSSVAPPVVVANLGESPREYLDRSGAKSNPEKITALGLYLRAQGSESFTARSLRDLFVAAGEATPQNLPRDIKRTVRAGFLSARPDQPDNYYVTNRGETSAESGFAERPSVARRLSRSRGTNGPSAEEGSPSAQRVAKNGGGARSVLDELLVERFFKEPRTYHDIVQTASEKGHRLVRTDLTQPLLNLVQARPPRLKRQKVKIAGTPRPVWAYTEPQRGDAA
jgi:hypothetical protein